jgi:hypothetical protein
VGGGDGEDGTDHGGFDDGAEGLVKVHARVLREATHNPPSFVSFEGAVALSLCRKSPLPVTMFASGGRGTRVDVPFAMRALYSSCIAVSQDGSRKAARTVFGYGRDGGCGG